MTASILFVCLGNICRSPLAEAAFRREVQAAGLDVAVESAGTGDWHIGHAPDKRAQAVAKKHGVQIGAFRARQVVRADFSRFTHIVALDAQNLADLQVLCPADATAALSLLLDYAPGRMGQSVTDPYYGDALDFDLAWSEIMAGVKGLLETLATR